jgi:hypothetical protein
MSKYLEILLSDCRPSGPEERSQTEPPFVLSDEQLAAVDDCAGLCDDTRNLLVRTHAVQKHRRFE